MRLPLLALFALILGHGVAANAAETIPKLQIEYNDWSNDDWAPGEGGFWSSDSSDETGECTWIGEALDSDCTVTPNTPQNPPAVAPDNCLFYDRSYDWFVYYFYGCG